MTTETKHMPSEREMGAYVSFDFIAAARRNDGSAVNEAERLLREHCVPMHGHKFRMVDHDALRALTAASQSSPPDQSERVGELEAELRRWKGMYLRDTQKLIDALAEARKVIEPFARADRAIGHEPGPFRFETGTGHSLIEREHLRTARDWLTRNPESPNGES